MQKPSSQRIRQLYSGSFRDEHVFELSDYSGLQIIRRYKDEKLNDKRMFIKFVLSPKDNYVWGGVDTVINKDSKSMGWTIVTSEKSPPTNYIFGDSENVRFDTGKNVVLLDGREYSIDAFIDILEKNHLRNMFRVSRLKNRVVLTWLHFLFFLTDSYYDKYKHAFENRPKHFPVKEQQKRHVTENTDPLFHFFRIYKNLLGLMILVLLTPLFYMSVCLEPQYFSVGNPFFLFLALFFLYLMEKTSDGLFYLLEKTGYVFRLTRAAIEERGTIKP